MLNLSVRLCLVAKVGNQFSLLILKPHGIHVEDDVDVFGWGSLGEDVVDVLGELAGVGAEDHELELMLCGFGDVRLF